MKELTARQQLVLDFIKSTVESRGYPPTLREIGDAVDIRSTNGVNDHLRALERKGYIARAEMASRGIRVLAEPAEPEPSPALPCLVAIDRSKASFALQKLESLRSWLPPAIDGKFGSALAELRTAILHGREVE